MNLETQNKEIGKESSRSDPCLKSSEQLVFLVGMWRSGTSLLHAFLNGHPQIALMYEAEPLDFWPKGTVSLGLRDWPERLEFLNQTMTRHGLNPAGLKAEKPDREGALALYRRYAEQHGAAVMGEKAPSYYARLPMLHTLFPEARFLIIWRDPTACCQSAAKAARTNRFFAQRGMLTRILLGSETLAEGVEWLRFNNAQVLEVVFDELVENPERELRRVCDFLLVPFVREMLDLKRADLSSLPPGEHHDGVRSRAIQDKHDYRKSVPAEFIAKGRRYAALWKERFSHLGFARALSCGPENAPPGAFERLADYCSATRWELVDKAKRTLFRNMPISWWRRMRSATPRANEASEPTLPGTLKKPAVSKAEKAPDPVGNLSPP
jgi:hypothetical protein